MEVAGVRVAGLALIWLVFALPVVSWLLALIRGENQGDRDVLEGIERAVDRREWRQFTFVEPLGIYVMTYTAYGPLGPRIALAWQRIGPV